MKKIILLLTMGLIFSTAHAAPLVEAEWNNDDPDNYVFNNGVLEMNGHTSGWYVEYNPQGHYITEGTMLSVTLSFSNDNLLSLSQRASVVIAGNGEYGSDDFRGQLEFNTDQTVKLSMWGTRSGVGDVLLSDLIPGGETELRVDFYQLNSIYYMQFLVNNIPYTAVEQEANDLVGGEYLPAFCISDPSGDMGIIKVTDVTFGNIAIPEPSTYAAIFGALVLGFVVYRRQK